MVLNEMVLWNCEYYMAYHERKSVGLNDTTCRHFPEQREENKK